MRIAGIYNTNFTGKIIDTHAHVGTLNGKNYKKEDLDVFVKTTLPNNDVVEKMYVSDTDVLTTLKSEYDGNKSLLNLFKGSDKYEVFAACSPQNGSVDNIKRLYEENPDRFIGLKFHPTIQKLSLSDNRYIPYMDFAEKNNIPCLFHSAVAVDEKGFISKSSREISDPQYIYSLAKKYKNTPVVMAHLGAGWNEAHDKAIDVLIESIEKGDANLYADISWVDIGLPHSGNFSKDEHRAKEHILKAIKKLKGIGNKDWKHGDQSFRLFFGSDAPIDRFADKNDRIKEYTTFIDDIKFAIRNDKDLKPASEKIIDDLFYNNAKKFYKRQSIKSTTKLPPPKNNLWKWILAGAVLISGAILALRKKIFKKFDWSQVRFNLLHKIQSLCK